MKPTEILSSLSMLVPSLGLSAAVGYTLGNPEKVRDSAVYGKYLAKHKYNVIGPMRQMGLGWGQALKHDLSKLSPAEFGPYRDWFAGSKGLKGTRDPQVFSKWRKAVNHHYNSPGNLHHYRKLPSTTPIADKYKLEAIADWYSVAKSNGVTNQSFKEWYTANRHRLPTENHIRAEMNKQLGLTKKASIVLHKLAFTDIHAGMTAAMDLGTLAANKAKTMLRGAPKVQKAVGKVVSSRPYKEFKEIDTWGRNQHGFSRKLIPLSYAVPVPGTAEAAIAAHYGLAAGTHYGTKLYVKNKLFKRLVDIASTLR